MIRPISPLDAEQICTIYNHYVENTVVTFEEEHVSDSEMAQRIKNVTSSLPWFVWENEGAIYGYAYATPWRTRSAYRFSVETIVYLAPDRTGLGLGSELYRVLIAELRSHRLHCAIGGIDLPPVVGPLIMREFSVLGSLNQSVLPAVSLKITSTSGVKPILS